jgi:hypothetical protein
MRRGEFCTREVCQLTGMSPKAVRALARAQVVGHRLGRRLRFAFGDLRVLRMGMQLVAQGLPRRQAVPTLLRLRQQVSAPSVPLSAISCSYERAGVVATDGVRRWQVAAGRPVAASDRPATPGPELVLLAAHRAQQGGCGVVHDGGAQALCHLPGHGAVEEADQWFNAALAAEGGDAEGAYRLYMRALACDPEHVEAILNVGRLCFADDDLPRAAAFFRLAVRIDGGHPVAHFNLAVALHDSGRLADACRSYRRALLFDRNFADAHFNLATLLDKVGRKREAAFHFSQYRAALLRHP